MALGNLDIWSAHRVGIKAASGVLLFSVISYGLVYSGIPEPATTGEPADVDVPGRTALQLTAGRLAVDGIDNHGAKQDSPWMVVRMWVTGYCPCRRCCGKYSDGITASGHKIRKGDEFVAADRKYSFDTWVIVPGYNSSRPVRVLDRGTAIRGNRLDVFFNSHREACEWGIRYLSIKVRTQ